MTTADVDSPPPTGVSGAVRIDDRVKAADWAHARALVAPVVATDHARISTAGWATTYDDGAGLFVCGAAHLVDDEASHGSSRLETVATLYRRHGLDAFARLQGQFCLALYDIAPRRLVLVTDRFSTRGLYYETIDGGVRFSSHLAALTPGHSIDPTAVLEYLLYAAIPHPRTPFAGIAKLMPGSLLVADSSGVRVSPYWDIAYHEERNGRSEADWAAALRAEIERTITRYVAAEADPAVVGAFLSGGTDSSTVAGFMRQARGGPTRTFSIGYAEAGYDELTYARAAVRRFGLEQHEHIFTAREAFEALPDVVSYYQEPFGNSSALPTYACARTAREHGVRVLFAGDGGDELFAGNTRYKSDKILGLYQRIPRSVRRLTDPLSQAIPDRWPVVGLAPRYVRRSNLPNPLRFFSYNLLLTAPLATMLAPDLLAAVDPTQLLASADERYRASGAHTTELNRLMHLDLKLAIADNDIRKVSGMTELAGVEVRYPLLDGQLADFSGRIPSALKLCGFKTRYLFKRALADFLPPEILSKPKHGFGAPIAGWMKRDPQWRTLVGDLLHDRRTHQRGYLQTSLLDNLWRQHQSEESPYYGDMLWPIVMLELWHRRHVDAPVAST